MARLSAVRRELAEATRVRGELWQEQWAVPESELAGEVERLSERIDALWMESRRLAAEIRHGARSEIIARARQTERIERDLTRRRPGVARAQR